MTYKIPDWLKEVPPGEYTLAELKEITGRDKSTLSRTLKNAHVQKKYGKLVRGHIVEVKFLWTGMSRAPAEYFDGVLHAE